MASNSEGSIGKARPFRDISCLELVAPKRPIVLAPRPPNLANEDFALLQAASLLQAQNGISATTAGSIFSDKSVYVVAQSMGT